LISFLVKILETNIYIACVRGRQLCTEESD
jgi:hypothetical protein